MVCSCRAAVGGWNCLQVVQGATGDMNLATQPRGCRRSATSPCRFDGIFGSAFNTNGLGGVLTCGVSGVAAGLRCGSTCCSVGCPVEICPRCNMRAARQPTVLQHLQLASRSPAPILHLFCTRPSCLDLALPAATRPSRAAAARSATCSSPCRTSGGHCSRALQGCRVAALALSCALRCILQNVTPQAKAVLSSCAACACPSPMHVLTPPLSLSPQPCSIDAKGRVGAISRPGRPGVGCACGALAKALVDIQRDGLTSNCKIPGGRWWGWGAVPCAALSSLLPDDAS